MTPAQSLKKSFRFKTFQLAIRFVVAVARIANRFQHHPDILIADSVVTLTSTTHDKGNVVTEKDRELMREVEKTYLKSKIKSQNAK